jgi:hypothetical protein
VTFAQVRRQPLDAVDKSGRQPREIGFFSHGEPATSA